MSKAKSRTSLATKRQCVEIIEAILDTCNRSDDGDMAVGFSRDWGGNSLTVDIDGGHTHVGMPEDTFEQFVDGLHAMLVHRRGLSIVRNQKKGGRS